MARPVRTCRRRGRRPHVTDGRRGQRTLTTDGRAAHPASGFLSRARPSAQANSAQIISLLWGDHHSARRGDAVVCLVRFVYGIQVIGASEEEIRAESCRAWDGDRRRPTGGPGTTARGKDWHGPASCKQDRPAALLRSRREMVPRGGCRRRYEALIPRCVRHAERAATGRGSWTVADSGLNEVGPRHLHRPRRGDTVVCLVCLAHRIQIIRASQDVIRVQRYGARDDDRR